MQKAQSEWIKKPAKYSSESLEINGRQVMQRWEAPYMQALARTVTTKGGRILEIGYGMGLSAKQISAAPIQSHVLIECHPDVIKRAKAENKNNERLILMEGFWEEYIDELPSNFFDGILYDAYPINAESMKQDNPFFKHAYRLLKPGGVFTYYSGATTLNQKHKELLQEAGFNNIVTQDCPVKPPRSCEYWKDNTLVIPILKK